MYVIIQKNCYHKFETFREHPTAYIYGIYDGNTLDICISNKSHNKNIKNIHVLRTITYPGSHSPPSYVASSRDARTAHAITRYGTAQLPYPWQCSIKHILYILSSTRSHVPYTHVMLLSIAQCM